MLNWRDDWTSANLGDTMVRLMTFQHEGVGLWLMHDDYYADVTLAREKRDYSRDVSQLGGYSPIWCLSPAPVHTVVPNRFSVQDLRNAEVFQIARCEMSLNLSNGLKDFTLIEFEIETNLIRRGITHSENDLVWVAPYIKRDSVVGMYRLEYDMESSTGWYYPSVHPIVIFREDACFTGVVQCGEYKG